MQSFHSIIIDVTLFITMTTMMPMMTIIMNDADLTSLIESSSSIQSWIQSSDMPPLYTQPTLSLLVVVMMMKMMMSIMMIMLIIRMTKEKENNDVQGDKNPDLTLSNNI